MKKIIPYIETLGQDKDEILAVAKEFESAGADEVYLACNAECEFDEETYLSNIKSILRQIDLPVNVEMQIQRFEDVKKAFYTGAKAVVIRLDRLEDRSIIKESIQRFGKDAVIVDLSHSLVKLEQMEELVHFLKESMVLHLMVSEQWLENVTKELKDRFELYMQNFKVLVAGVNSGIVTSNEIVSACEAESIIGYVSDGFQAASFSELKLQLKNAGLNVNTFESSIPFEKFSCNSDGLIPVVVQDYKINEVLMVAYMNEEAYRLTIQTGRMTYYSRSRQKLWIKGETSGNFQYVKELRLDCDNDTILAIVRPAGPACHTGNRSCFYQELMKREYDSTNPFHVFEDVYGVIMDRKAHPKEGSYTNYLFEKGIDKILKKCGEEATEIVIAAKNPDPEELKYEISDFLYHCMVLMAEKGVSWRDICEELANRE